MTEVRTIRNHSVELSQCPVAIDDLLRGNAKLAHRFSAVRVVGRDTLTYLQGQLTIDVLSLSTGVLSASLLLDPSGKVVALLGVLRLGDEEVLLLVDPGTGEELLARLRRFFLRVKATLTREEVDVVISFGRDEAAAPAMIDGGGVGDVVTMTGGAFPGSSLTISSIEVVVDRTEGINEVHARPAVAATAGDLYHSLRLRSGWPSMLYDSDANLLPASLGENLTMVVSFDKGCYTGQELVARMDSRGSRAPWSIVVLKGGHAATIVPLLPEGVGGVHGTDGVEVGSYSSVGVDEDGSLLLCAHIKRAHVHDPSFSITSADGRAFAVGSIGTRSGENTTAL